MPMKVAKRELCKLRSKKFYSLIVSQASDITRNAAAHMPIMSIASRHRLPVDLQLRPRPQVVASAKKAKQKAKGFTKKKNSPAKPTQEPREVTSNAPVDFSDEANGDADSEPNSVVSQHDDGALGDSEEQEYRVHIDLLASGADGEESLPAVTKGQVLGACFRISAGMLLISFPAREFVRVTAAQNMGTSQQDVDRLLQIPSSLDFTHVLAALAAAGAVTAARTALLQVWPEFAAATDRSNKQVLSPLGPLDLALVSFLPGISEEALFRGTFIPATFPDWRGAILAGAAFGVLHNNGGRNWAFAAWAGAVGALYGALFLYTEDITSPMLAHSLANLASAALWLETRSDKAA